MNPGEQGGSETAFCVACGDPNPIADGTCLECLRAEITVVRGPSGPVGLERCVHCGAIPVREHWNQPTSLLEATEQAAIGSVLIPEALEDVDVRVAVREEDKKNYVVNVEVTGTYKGVTVEGEEPVRVQVKNVTCQACSRKHGGYYEAIVQVREKGDAEVSDERAGEIALMIEEEVRRVGGLSGTQSYLLKAEARHGGYDYYFGAKPVAKNIAKRIKDRYGGSLTHSTTLAGEEDGQEVHRLTIAVRLPRVTKGSVIGYEDEIVEVYGRSGNRVLGRTVPEGAGRTIEERHLDRAVILEPTRVDVVYAEAGEGQILDPESFDAVQVRLPEGIESGGSAWAVKHRERWVVMEPATPEAEA